MAFFPQYKSPFKRWQQSLLLISSMAMLSACANKPPRTEFYNAAGQPSHAVHCSVGAYESCLQQMGDICNEEGYTVLEKIRQMRSGTWNDDGPETLLVAQCKANAK